MEQALYRKYRSKTLNEVIGQEHITTTLSNALKNNSVSHAYLFTGPRGVGKTSVARILAYSVNGLEYNDATGYLDIIEIDAASNRRIDEIREIRDKVNVAPSHSKYKVYIIDEVHMLTKEAFNALLKTLEEPPEHVIFILATTEYSKLPDTIVSRTQHFAFKAIDEKTIANHLIKIAGSEGISLNNDAALLIAKHGDGSFRDSISLLDKLSSYSDVISDDIVRSGLGIPPLRLIYDILNTITNQAASEIIKMLEDAYALGYEPSIVSQYEARIRYLNDGDGYFLNLYKDLVSIVRDHDSKIMLEIVLLEANANYRNLPDISKIEDPTSIQKEDSIINELNNETDVPKNIDTTSDTQTKPKEKNSKWQAVVSELKNKHNTLYSFARMAKASESNDEILLSFKFPFHYKRICETKNIELIKSIVEEVYGQNLNVRCTLSQDNVKNDDTNLVTINNIFGASEVLES
ncbi:DNA polymerase III subunit gamma/tau [Candidatus Saccharibacteria bacterium]|nr:DNA polymerase III subunit gamma/tau [Candidatus Saccharibacteria bacterium]